ncbi:44838_t:CDS:2 [Gigaspora margarita]|uniref:44838_t:CDS:1 n=1 Tax=Gigaspora margarita TaxID=4874 RepID=A0ABN7W6Y8_GIGMA|nr:44838_t:CDS:2 [Gigaspora margarita]
MKLDDFSLEILVNGKPLQEFTEKISNNNVMTTGPSYLRKGIAAPEEPSLFTHYAAVQEFGTRYTIKVSVPPSCCSTENPIKVFLYVDGEFDYSYTDLNPTKLSETRTCFWSKNRDKIYYFKFDPTIWSEEKDGINNISIQKRCLFGGPGAISAYFYRAERVPWNVSPPPDYDVESTVIPENNDTRAIKLTTQYEVRRVSNPSITRFSTYLQEKGYPLAVFHLHYRAAAWLRARGHDVPFPRPTNQLTMISNNVDLEHNGIKRERIEIKEESDDEVVIFNNIKRPKREQNHEVIVISSDEDED